MQGAKWTKQAITKAIIRLLLKGNILFALQNETSHRTYGQRMILTDINFSFFVAQE